MKGTTMKRALAALAFTVCALLSTACDDTGTTNDSTYQHVPVILPNPALPGQFIIM